jgi:hypothetical protein
MEDILIEYEKTLLKEIKNRVFISHSHPPVKHVVDGCLYCAIYGNILVEPHITMTEGDVKTFLKT